MKGPLIASVLVIAALGLMAKVESKGYLTHRDIQLINDYKEEYISAAAKTGVPLLILPAIHYRESHLMAGWFSFKRNEVVENIGGSFMMDLGPLNDGAEFTKRIRQREKNVYDIYIKRGPVPKVSDDLGFAVLCAAYELTIKARCKEWHISEDCLSDIVWGYNGRAKWSSLKESAYVWSDPKNGTKFTYKYKRPNGEVLTFTDKRPGVMVIYKELQRLESDGKLWLDADKDNR